MGCAALPATVKVKNATMAAAEAVTNERVFIRGVSSGQNAALA